MGSRVGGARLAGAGRAVEQLGLGRIDAEPLENLRVAQGKLDHLAKLVDGRADAAQIVIGDVGAAGLLGLGIFGAKLDLGVGVDMNDALGRRRDDRQPDLLKRISGRIQHLTKPGRYSAAVDALLAGRGDDVRSEERLVGKACVMTLKTRWSPVY